LILYILTVPEPIIAADYAHTNKEMGHLAVDLNKHLDKSGLDETWFLVKEETMHKTFTYIRDRYGSVEAWLDQIGFTANDRKNMREACTAP
ncbi:hypothetical protein HDU93_005302, partial [Gonapodya sp. JEL0774]